MSRPAAGVCPGCGARTLAGWRVCPRCRGSLANGPSRGTSAAAAPQSAGSGSRYLVAGAGVLVVAVIGLGVWQATREAPQPLGEVASEAVRKPAVGVEERPADGPAGLPQAPVITGEAARRGLQAYAEGNMTAALAAFQQAVADQPQDAESLNNLGQVLVRLGRVPEALPLFDRAIALAPGKWSYRFNRARARGLAGDWAGAVEGYEEADGLFPDDYATLFNLGLALQKLGRHADAAPVLERAASQSEADASLLLPLGLSYEALGRNAEAIEVYRRYLEQAPASADAPAVQARLERLGSNSQPPTPDAQGSEPLPPTS